MEPSCENTPDLDELILVDSKNQILGYLDKESAHDGLGVLHRAFSVFLVNGKGEILLQKRSEEKRLWPAYWSNAVCSHPRRGEEVEQAAHRRLQEELGIDAELQSLFSFEYQASFGEAGSEHELCEVFWGLCDQALAPNPAEISDTLFISPQLLSERIKDSPDEFTPWFKMEWARIQDEFSRLLARA